MRKQKVLFLCTQNSARSHERRERLETTRREADERAQQLAGELSDHGRVGRQYSPARL